MINFNMMNICSTKLNGNLLESKSNKSNNESDFSLNFSNVMKKTINSNKQSSTDNAKANPSERKVLKDIVKKEDIKNVLDELKEELGDEYSDEDIVNIFNLCLFINYLEDNKESLTIKDINFELLPIEDVKMNEQVVDGNLMLNGHKNKDVSMWNNLDMDKIIEGFELKDEVLTVPILESMNFEATQINEDDLKIVEDVNKSFENQEVINDNIDIEKLSQEDIDEIVFKFESKTQMKNSDFRTEIPKVMEVIKSNELMKDVDAVYNSPEIDDSKNSLNLEIKEFDSVDLKDIYKELNVKRVEYTKHPEDINQIKEEIKGFNDFINRQRVSIPTNQNTKTIDDDTDWLLKIVNKKGENEVVENINPDTYGIGTIKNDTIIKNSIPLVIRQSFISQDISQTIEYMKHNNMNELVVKVKPKELGEISIQLLKNDGILDVVLTVEQEEVFNNTKKSLNSIITQLKNSGFKVGDISIQMKSDDNLDFNFMSGENEKNSTNQGHSGESKNNSRKYSEKIEDEVSSSEIEYKTSENEVNLLA